MKNNISSSIGLVALLAVIGCSTPQKTGLELQAFQKKQFETTKKIAFASVMSVFQDMGYTIKQANTDTGFIQASSPTKNMVLFGSHMSNTDATAFVEEINEKNSAIRLNFVQNKESSSGYGMKSKSDKPVLDPKVYEGAFNKIQEAVFIRNSSK